MKVRPAGADFFIKGTPEVADFTDQKYIEHFIARKGHPRVPICTELWHENDTRKCIFHRTNIEFVTFY